jgi:hypothetical protein
MPVVRLLGRQLVAALADQVAHMLAAVLQPLPGHMLVGMLRFLEWKAHTPQAAAECFLAVGSQQQATAPAAGPGSCLAAAAAPERLECLLACLQQCCRTQAVLLPVLAPEDAPSAAALAAVAAWEGVSAPRVAAPTASLGTRLSTTLGVGPVPPVAQPLLDTPAPSVLPHPLTAMGARTVGVAGAALAAYPAAQHPAAPVLLLVVPGVTTVSSAAAPPAPAELRTVGATLVAVAAPVLQLLAPAAAPASGAAAALAATCCPSLACCVSRHWPPDAAALAAAAHSILQDMWFSVCHGVIWLLQTYGFGAACVLNSIHCCTQMRRLCRTGLQSKQCLCTASNARAVHTRCLHLQQVHRCCTGRMPGIHVGHIRAQPYSTVQRCAPPHMLLQAATVCAHHARPAGCSAPSELLPVPSSASNPLLPPLLP